MQGTDADQGRDTIRIRLSEPKWVDALVIAGGAALVFAGPVVLALLTVLLGFRRWRLARCELVLSDRGIVLRSYSLSPFFLWPRPYYLRGRDSVAKSHGSRRYEIADDAMFGIECH